MAKKRTRGSIALAQALQRSWETQADGERRVGVSRGTFTRWLNGTRKPGRELACLLRDIYGIDPAMWA